MDEAGAVERGRHRHRAWARLNGPLAVGTIGRVKPRRGPASALTITALDVPTRFACRTRSPGASMRFEHQLEGTATETAFTHRFVLIGPTSVLLPDCSVAGSSLASRR